MNRDDFEALRSAVSEDWARQLLDLAEDEWQSMNTRLQAIREIDIGHASCPCCGASGNDPHYLDDCALARAKENVRHGL
jgi:uncharacterized protein (UPF0212 family)